MFAFYQDFNEILQRVDQIKVWSYICGFPVQIGQRIYNPLRLDNHPNCYLYEYDNNVLLADWSDKSYHGIGVIKALQEKDDLTYKQVLQKLNTDTFLYPSSMPHIKPRTKPNDFKFYLEFLYKKFTKTDHKYWSQFGITIDQLEYEGIHKVDYYFRNSRKRPDLIVQCKAAPNAYGVVINGRKKLYQPFSNYKWLTTFNEHDIGGVIDRDSPVLIITKSFKDYLVIKYHTTYNVQYIPSESVSLTSFYLDIIKDSYKLIVVLMDNDETGHKAAKRIASQIGSNAVAWWLEEANDPAEYYKKYGNIDIITSFIKNKLNDTINYTPVVASNYRQVLSG